ncbi:MAG: hypothetical protein WDN27_06735 [Candidatus Saccharibacteria bacterium]
MHGRTLLGRAEHIHLELVELVHAEEATGVLAVRTRFLAVTWAEARIFERQIGFIDDLIGMIAVSGISAVAISNRSSPSIAYSSLCSLLRGAKPVPVMVRLFTMFGTVMKVKPRCVTNCNAYCVNAFSSSARSPFK